MGGWGGGGSVVVASGASAGTDGASLTPPSGEEGVSQKSSTK